MHVTAVAPMVKYKVQVWSNSGTGVVELLCTRFLLACDCGSSYDQVYGTSVFKFMHRSGGVSVHVKYLSVQLQ